MARLTATTPAGKGALWVSKVAMTRSSTTMGVVSSSVGQPGSPRAWVQITVPSAALRAWMVRPALNTTAGVPPIRV